MIFSFFNAEYNPTKMPVIKHYFFRLDEGQALLDELCKQMNASGMKQPVIEEDK
ncbi:MAG: hypothetical protein P4M11_09080 [Candidatus Pacebacteria bacterium]|nr:hypothetical protein [Candidatus Paceibacterota bacterium]